MMKIYHIVLHYFLVTEKRHAYLSSQRLPILCLYTYTVLPPHTGSGADADDVVTQRDYSCYGDDVSMTS